MNSYIDLVNTLNYISDNEESIEMPGGYKQFNLHYFADDWYELHLGDILLFESFNGEQYNFLQILNESLEVIKDEIEKLQYAQSVLEFAIHEEKQKPQGRKNV